MPIRNKNNGCIVAAILSMSFFASQSHAGPYSDDLGKCLIEKSSEQDKTKFVRWTFSLIALHPDVKNLSGVTDSQRQRLNVEVAGVVERLLTEDCLNKARKAFEYEGENSIVQAFRMFGTVATKRLMDNPEVSAGAEQFIKYIDEKKLESVGDSDK